jgi:hypothetical protein
MKTKDAIKFIVTLTGVLITALFFIKILVTCFCSTNILDALSIIMKALVLFFLTECIIFFSAKIIKKIFLG